MDSTEPLQVRITKKRSDPLGVVRVSLGGAPEIGGYYCVYRGTKEQAIECLEKSLQAMKAMARHLRRTRPDANVAAGGQEPDVSPDDGKEFA